MPENRRLLDVFGSIQSLLLPLRGGDSEELLLLLPWNLESGIAKFLNVTSAVISDWIYQQRQRW